jgi:hypothetical protein
MLTPRLDRAALVQKLATMGASAETLATLERDLADPGDSMASDRALRTVAKDYAAAAALAESGDPSAALALAKVLGQARDPLVVAHARYHLARVMLDADDPDGAASVLEEYLAESRGITTLDADAVFHFCLALARIPMAEDAARNFHAFLKLYPDSPERLIATAQQILAELESQFQNPLHGIADEMKGVERKIRKTDTGEKTQTRQKDIVETLTQLIEEMEKRERQGGGGSPSGNQQSGGPASESSAPPGPTRIGGLHSAGKVKDRWGMLKDRERNQILTELQTKLPDRYRSLLEDYYKKLNQGGR